MIAGVGGDAMTCDAVDSWVEGWIHEEVGGTTGGRVSFVVGGVCG